MSETDLRILIKQRGQYKSQLTRFVSFVSNLPESLDNKTIIELKTRLNKLETVYDAFENVQSSLEIMDEGGEQITERESFENQFYNIVAIANDKITCPSMLTAPSPNDPSPLVNNVNVKLPQISIPEFNGSYDRWLQFHDCFNALIHNNSALTNVQKFYYLQTALKGEASGVIRALEVSDGNYNIAWKMLKERYENKRIIIHSHVKNLFELPSVSKESHTQLRKLVDSFVTHFRCLKNLEQPVQHWDTLLIYLISNKLDSTTRKEWEISIKENNIPTTDEFISFLTNKCLLLETMENKTNTISSSKTFSKGEKRTEKTFSHVLQNDTCLLCKGTHSLFYCKKLLNLSPKDRYTEIKKLNICTNCLKSGHFNNTCSASCCKTCGKRHNTILHFGSDTADNARVSQQQAVNSSDAAQVQGSREISSKMEPSVSTHCTHSQNSLTLLQTAIIYVLDSQGVKLKCRALLDSGSQANFMTNNLFKKLNIDQRNVDLPIAGINNATMHVSSKTQATIQSVHNSCKYSLQFLIINKITGNIPSISFGKSNINIPENITLADPEFNKPGEIDILLGSGIFFDLMCVGQIKTGKNQPILQKSKLGWVVAGPLCNFTDQSYLSYSSFLSTNSDIQSTLEKFWVIEECPPKANRSQEEIECEKHFTDNLERDSSGHFIVKLPLRENYTGIGESLQVATKRLLSVERKLNRDPITKLEYHNFMREYIELGHMSQIDLETDHDNIKYYLPHSSVSKTSSVTTKLRVVFDASCKSDTGISLNDVLKVGPVIQDDLFVILLRFRKHNYIITADITKMYRQVFIHKDHRDLQRIIWRFDTESDIQHFQLNTVTYGTASASFLATRALQQAAFDYQTSHPEACRVILSDFYVDDLISGSHDIETTIQLKTDISQILSKSGFPLRKWNSNNEQILASDSNDENSTSEYYIINSNETKILGISWDTKQDSLRYTVISDDLDNHKVTKRLILSVVSRIFDPLGLLGPVIIKAKLILQQLWQHKLNWDEPVPIELRTMWLSFQKQILQLNHLKIPRQVLLFNAIKFQIHGFCDSSQYAYGCAIYIRSENADGDISVNLLCAKSRVAPIKTISIPKLELCGALLLAQLVNKVSTSFTSDSSDIYYWTDSTISLAWISSQPNTLKTFVANRVSDIQQLSEASQWRHVSSEDNAADIISRGLNPDQLINSSLWWHGPSFLSLDLQFWPKSCDNYISEIPEKRNITHSLICAVDQTIFDKFSSFSKLQRVTAFCLRFINNTRNRHLPKNTGELTPGELNNSIIELSKMAQQSSFIDDIRSLKRTGTVPMNSKLLSLAPFLDENNVIRVGGRLKNSQLEYNQIHPIVLPSKHNFTKLLIRHEHLKNLHAGAQFILANIRKQFWPLNGRGTVRSVLRQCVTCFRARPSNMLPQMGNLPGARVTPGRPFQKCGLDYAGPIMIKDGKLRNRAFVKAYLCIFVCFATKATHIEVVSDLTTKGFLNVFKRFVSRRGLCEHIYSDNATNFVGAKNELEKISSDSLTQDNNFKTFISDNHIEWHFIPPKSPHFGGLWEAAVKSAKSHLLRIVGNTTLTYESLCTVVVQIEAILNSRPLYPMSNDPNDLLPLTPGHFLIGTTLNALPQSNVQEETTNKISHYHQLQQMVQHFWTRWSSEYLNTLQQRSKWKVNKASNMIIGALVLLKADNTAPMQWKLGRVVEIHPGADKVVRVVSVKTSAGVFRRSVHKICLLPIET